MRKNVCNPKLLQLLVNSFLVLISIIHCTFSIAQNYTPIGYLDYVNPTYGNGWAFDADNNTQAIDIHIYIDGRFYKSVSANESRPDLVTAGVAPNPEHGFSFNIVGYDTSRAHEVIVYAINYGGGINPILINCPVRIGPKPIADATISNGAGKTAISITTTERLAGAIHSLTWNGKEFINSYDHGRELQSAASFNGFGECYNPTEAGSNQDWTGNTSTSFLQYLFTSGNFLETQTLPAFWTQPDQIAPGCGIAINSTQRSSIYFRKKITIGMPGMANVIRYDTEFDIPESFTSATFEVLTGYMPPEFSEFWNYDPENLQLDSLSDGPGEQEIPIILATIDKNFAMGIYSPDQPRPQWGGAGYGRWRFDDCTKWNCVFRESSIVPGIYKYRSYVIVGSLSDVEVNMTDLYNYFKITANFSADTVCFGEPSHFMDLTQGKNDETTYQWDINNDGIVEDSTTGSLTYMFPGEGIYQVKLSTINGIASSHQSSIIKNVVVLAPPSVGPISGNTSICESLPHSYSITKVSGASSYAWSLPIGWDGDSDSASIDIIPGGTGGKVSVSSVNSCGVGLNKFIDVTVIPLPSLPGTISGETTVCQEQISVSYNVSQITNTNEYVWTLPSGASGTSLTNKIAIDYGPNSTSGIISVNGKNSCGDGPLSSLTVNVKNKPLTPSIALKGDVLHSNATNGNQWFNQNGLIPGAVNQDYTPVISGDYFLVLTSNGCSSDNSQTINLVLTNLESKENINSIQIYPNPVTNSLSIEYDGNPERINFEIFNSTGQIVLKGKLLEKTVVQTKDFNPGVYIIKFNSDKSFKFNKIIKD
jgi:hypothetical protein